MVKAFEIFKMFFLLGLTSFGGLTAHIGYLHNKFVQDNNWFSAKDFLASCNLPDFSWAHI
jgi:chromate transporter